MKGSLAFKGSNVSMSLLVLHNPKKKAEQLHYHLIIKIALFIICISEDNDTAQI